MVGSPGRGQGALVPSPEDSREGRQCPGCSQLARLPNEEWFWDQVVVFFGGGQRLAPHSCPLAAFPTPTTPTAQTPSFAIQVAPRPFAQCPLIHLRCVGLTLAELALQELGARVSPGLYQSGAPVGPVRMLEVL